MLQITVQYADFRTDVAFLRVKSAALAFPYYAAVFHAHVFASMAVLALGGVQLSPKLGTAAPVLHRYLGRAYVALVLLVAAPSGLVMAAHANGGWTAQTAFVSQAVLWWWFTYRAVAVVRAGDIGAHRRYMLFSYALTLSALSLRLWKWGLVAAFAPAPMDLYRAVAWLGWVGNLGVAWWWTRARRPLSPTSPPPPPPTRARPPGALSPP